MGYLKDRIRYYGDGSLGAFRGYGHGDRSTAHDVGLSKIKGRTLNLQPLSNGKNMNKHVLEPCDLGGL
jgi:hypothetical protein